MALVYFMLAVAVLAGILAGASTWNRTHDVLRTVVAGLLAVLAMMILGGAIALVSMMIWPPLD